MITAERMAQVDANAEALGVPRKQLMESSGRAVAEAVREESDEGDRVVVLAGRGNNGGDGFVAARFLDDRDVTVLLLGRRETISTDIARENWDALRAAEYDAREVRDSSTLALSDPDVVVDAMLGTGVSGAPREPVASGVWEANDADATVVSVDVPTGLDADTGDAPGAAVEADRVVTFHDEKPGLSDLDAEVTVADIGIPDAAELFVGPGDLRVLGRDESSHKGDNGEVLVVGGGPYTGAPALSAAAALRAGADLVRVACPESVADEVQGYGEHLIVRPLPGDRLEPGHADRLLDLAGGHDVVVVGPGLGDAEGTLSAVREFLRSLSGRAVVDADALQVVPDVADETEATLVCTPHRGELEGMGGPTAESWEERAELVTDFAGELGHVLLVKSRYDVISDGEDVRVNRTGNAGMTVGGTGDVLAGVTGAFLSRVDPLEAAAVAARVNGVAGDLAVEDRDQGGVGGYGLLPGDLVDRLPVAWGDRDG